MNRSLRIRGALYGAAVWTLLVLIGVPVWSAVLLLPTTASRWKLVRVAGRLLCFAAGVPVAISGSPPDRERPYVVVANHESFVDALAIILAFPAPVAFVAGTAFARQRIAGPFLRKLGCRFVGAGKSPGRLLEQLQDLLGAGHSLAFFPEGSLSSDPSVRRFRSGAFVAAANAGRPVVPVGISGTRQIVPPGRRMPRRGRVAVAIGDPIEASGNDRRATREFSEIARNAVQRLVVDEALLSTA